MSQVHFPGWENTHTLADTLSHFTLPFEETDGSIPLRNTQTKGFSPIFRNKYLKDGSEPASFLQPSLNTFYQVFEEGLKIHGDNGSLGSRKFNKETNKFDEFYTWETYNELAAKRTLIGSAFIHLVKTYTNVDPSNFIVTLFSANKPEWLISDLACHAYSIPNAPLYDTLGKESTEYILKLTESPIIVLSKNKIQKVFEANSSFLKLLISIESFNEQDQKLIQDAKLRGYTLLEFNSLYKIGKEHQIPHIPPTPQTLYTICFTSGTTGTPKGVELTHANVAAATAFLYSHIEVPRLPPCSLLFLPLAHSYERFKNVFELTEGSKIGFPHDPENVKTYLEDIKILKPTHMSSVPRLYNRIEAGLKEKIKDTPGFKGWLLRLAVDYKVRTDDQSSSTLSKIFNVLVINKIKKQLGFENLCFLVTGGSPLSGESIIYLRNVLDCGFYQGYGATETFGGITITTNHAKDPSRLGGIGITAEFKLRDLPDLEYTYDTNRSGELLLRGPQVFKKYFKNEKATLDSVDSEGWYSTGDIVQLDEENRIKIIDRVKNFFKLSQGEYIPSEKIENDYISNNLFISQIFVYGNSFQNYLVGIVGIEPELLLKYVKSSSYSTKISTHEQLLANLDSKDFRKFILTELNKNIEHTGLFSFEKLKNIHLKVEPFKIEDDTITPTLKLKRNKAQKFYQTEIDTMYEEGMI